MRKITALILSVFLMLTLCQQSPAGAVTSHTSDMTVSKSPDVSGTSYCCQIGIAMPDKTILRWERDGTDIKKQLEEKGYTVELMFANNDVATQDLQSLGDIL